MGQKSSDLVPLYDLTTETAACPLLKIVSTTDETFLDVVIPTLSHVGITTTPNFSFTSPLRITRPIV